MYRRIVLLAVAVVVFISGCATPFVLDGKAKKVRKTWVTFCNKNVDRPIEYLIFVPPTNGFKTGDWVYVEVPTLMRPAAEKKAGLSLEAVLDQINELQEKVRDLQSERSDSAFVAGSDSVRTEVRQLQKRLRAERAERLAKGNGGPLEAELTTAVECPVGWVTFGYYVLEGSRPRSNFRTFDFFVKPADEGNARVINLAGDSL